MVDPQSTTRPMFDGQAVARKLDTNKDGKVTRNETPISQSEFKALDLNHDGNLAANEINEAHFQANTFAALNSAHADTLDATAMSKLDRYDTSVEYDKDHDGKVTQDEFFAGRRAENMAARKELWREQFAKLSDAQKAKVATALAKQPDALTPDDYVNYQINERRKAWTDRRDELFAAAGGQKSGLKLSDPKAKQYASYDTNSDGVVTREEFQVGAEKDRVEGMRERMITGKVTDKNIRSRIQLDELGHRIPVAAPGQPAGPDHFYNNRKSWFISQYAGDYNPNAPRGNSDCGPTSLTMVAKAFGVIHPTADGAMDAIHKTRAKMGVSTSDFEGSSYPDVDRGAKAYGLDSHILYGGHNHTADAAAKELAKGRLIVANVMPTYLFPGQGSGHYTVVTKVDSNYVYLNDPAQPDGPMRITREQFESACDDKGTYALVSIGRK